MRCHFAKVLPFAWAITVACGAILATPSASDAQVSCEVPRYAPQCGDDYTKPKCAPQPQPQQFPQYAPPGAFVAPPQSGVTQGASEGYGVRGMEIEFPALRLRMPSISFPAWYSTRENAKMVLDSANAPFVPGNFAAFPVAPAYGGVPSQAPKQTPTDQPPANYPQEPYRAPGCNADPYYAPKAPNCNAQYPYQPSAEWLAIEQRIRQLAETEQRLQGKLNELQTIYQQMAAMEARRAQQIGHGDEEQHPVRYAADVRELPRRVPVSMPAATETPPAGEVRYPATPGVRRVPTWEE